MATDVKKNPVRETEVWSLADWVKNLSTGIGHPSNYTLLMEEEDAGVKIVTFRIAANTMVWNERGKFSFLTS